MPLTFDLSKHLKAGLCLLILVSVKSALADTPVVDNQTKQECLSKAALLQRDARYEQALLNDDYAFFEANLHPDFVWVHNHASYVQNSREALVAPMRKRKAEKQASHSTKRSQELVEVLIAGSTAVVHGFTVVERASSPRDSQGNVLGDRYHFMRTYYKEKDTCLLLANHTMLIPKDEK